MFWNTFLDSQFKKDRRIALLVDYYHSEKLSSLSNRNGFLFTINTAQDWLESIVVKLRIILHNDSIFHRQKYCWQKNLPSTYVATCAMWAYSTKPGTYNSILLILLTLQGIARYLWNVDVKKWCIFCCCLFSIVDGK